MSALEILILALILDALFGDPDSLWRRLPHPAALMGRAVSALDARLNTGPNRKRAGAVALALLLIPTALIGQIIASIPDAGLLEILIAAILLAQNSLVKHVRAVALGLKTSLAEGRRAVAMIVGRDAQSLDETGVARSAIESAAENFSDGVVAPAFWLLVFGLPGILVYKMANTADSMIGYRSEKYAQFGWAAARFDDLINWIPARLTGLLICLAHGSVYAFKIMRRDAPLHRSPNAGWPESATAAIAGVAISGPRTYDGIPTNDPFVHAEGRRIVTSADILRATRILWQSWGVLLAALILTWLIL